MSGKVTINSTSLHRKLAAMAIFSQRGLLVSVRDGAKRFVVAAVKNTDPMILSKSPSQAKRDWEAKRTQHYESRRITAQGYRSDAEVRKILRAKKKQLGRAAAGWNRSARALGAKVPAWVRRHGAGEGMYRQTRIGRHGLKIYVTNSVPYNQSQTLKRATFALRRVEQGVNGNLRNIKRKVIRQVR